MNTSRETKKRERKPTAGKNEPRQASTKITRRTPTPSPRYTGKQGEERIAPTPDDGTPQRNIGTKPQRMPSRIKTCEERRRGGKQAEKNERAAKRNRERNGGRARMRMRQARRREQAHNGDARPHKQRSQTTRRMMGKQTPPRLTDRKAARPRIEWNRERAANAIRYDGRGEATNGTNPPAAPPD